jgi:hypothetical protein
LFTGTNTLDSGKVAWNGFFREKEGLRDPVPLLRSVLEIRLA